MEPDVHDAIFPPVYSVIVLQHLSASTDINCLPIYSHNKYINFRIEQAPKQLGGRSDYLFFSVRVLCPATNRVISRLMPTWDSAKSWRLYRAALGTDTRSRVP